MNTYLLTRLGLVKYDRLYFTALMGWESGYEVFHEAPFILKQEFENIHLIGEV